LTPGSFDPLKNPPDGWQPSEGLLNYVEVAAADLGDEWFTPSTDPDPDDDYVGFEVRWKNANGERYGRF
jgi:hypothetical protein